MEIIIGIAIGLIGLIVAVLVFLFQQKKVSQKKKKLSNYINNWKNQSSPSRFASKT